MRQDIHEYFFDITKTVATRSTCLRRQVGAIIVKNKQILATGYNGAPKGTAHCIDIGCLRNELGIPSGERHELCKAVHAEMSAIIQAGLNGANLEGSTIYITHAPCVICSKMLINAGIEEIYYLDSYPDEHAERILKEANMKVFNWKEIKK